MAGLFELVEEVMSHGHLVYVDGRETLELTGVTATRMVGEYIPWRPGMSLDLARVAALQTLTGIVDHEWLHQSAGVGDVRVNWYSHAEVERMGEQIPTLLEEWRRDGRSRRLVMDFVHHDEEPANRSCVLTCQFLYRRMRLDSVVTIRSWDLAKLMGHDVLFLDCLHRTLAREMGVWPGAATYAVGSAHLYIGDLDYARQLGDQRVRVEELPQLVPDRATLIESHVNPCRRDAAEGRGQSGNLARLFPLEVVS